MIAVIGAISLSVMSSVAIRLWSPCNSCHPHEDVDTDTLTHAPQTPKSKSGCQRLRKRKPVRGLGSMSEKFQGTCH